MPFSIIDARSALAGVLLAAGLAMPAAPAHAGSAVAEAAGRVLAYYYSMEELASFCQAVLPSAAPSLGVSFAQWQARNEPRVQRVHERFAVELAKDLDQPVESPAVQRELRDNLRTTRNATAEFQRNALERGGSAAARDTCGELDVALETYLSDIDLRNPDDWAVLFSAAPANPGEVVGHWSTGAGCRGEVWTLHADGHEQLTAIADGSVYAYRGLWTLAEGLYSSKGEEHTGARVRQIGNLMIDPGGTRLTLTLTEQTVTSGGQPRALVSSEQPVTVHYQRCDDAAAPSHYDFDAAAKDPAHAQAERSQPEPASPPAGRTAPPDDRPADDPGLRRGPRRR